MLKLRGVREIVSRVLRSLAGATDAQLVGAAANPRLVPRPNPPGTPSRTLAEALQIAVAAGVEIDEDIFAFSISPQPIVDAGATYFRLRCGGPPFMVELKRILDNEGRFHVRICPTILNSDEEIVHVLAHEVYEATRLRTELEKSGGRLTASVVHSLVDPTVGTLHCDAWDHADEIVRRRRGSQNV